MATIKEVLKNKTVLNTKEAAQLLNVTTQTIKNYIYSGKLKALKTPGGHHRIRKDDLKEFGFLSEEKKSLGEFTLAELRDAYDHLMESYLSTVKAIIKALDTRDIVSSGHSVRVAELAYEIGKHMQIAERELWELKLAGLLHDVGKIGIGENILGKPGKLTDQEFFFIKKHPEIGAKIIEEVEFLKPIAESVKHHHERFDGKGYPDGIGGNEIDIRARIISVAETYDFLRSDLFFRGAYSIKDSLNEINRAAGAQFDPQIVKVFSDYVAEKTDSKTKLANTG